MPVSKNNGTHTGEFASLAVTDPITTTDSSATVNLEETGHDWTVGDRVDLLGLTTVNSLDCNGLREITVVVDVDNVEFEHESTASGTGSGGGSGGSYDLEELLAAAITDPGTYVLIVDLVNMVASDDLDIVVDVLPKTAGVYAQGQRVNKLGAQADDLYQTGPFVVLHGIKCYLRQQAGTSRTFDWDIVQV